MEVVTVEEDVVVVPVVGAAGAVSVGLASDIVPPPQPVTIAARASAASRPRWCAFTVISRALTAADYRLRA